jgi:hypothetical protein
MILAAWAGGRVSVAPPSPGKSSMMEQRLDAFWIKLGLFTRDRKGAIIGTCMLVVLPFGYFALQAKISADGALQLQSQAGQN